MPAPDVAALLAELERSEPDVAESARLAVEWLAGGEALETISQLDVCEFLWHTLPVKVRGDRHAIARALGELLRLGGMNRYAALCDSAATERILRVYAREGEEAGSAAYHQALEATGVLPPDIPELSWSSIMGPEEMGAHVACAAALELAIVAGDPVDREELTRRWLTAERPELGGDCWLHRVQGERLNRWVLGRGSARRELAQPFEVRLHAPIPAPDGPCLEPLRWLLDLARTGIRLTERLNLATAVVQEGAGRFAWPPPRGRVVRVEADLPPLTALRELAVELRAVRRSGRRLVLTPTGRAMLDDPRRLWEAATSALLAPAQGERDLDVSIREIAMMMLVDGGEVAEAELRDRVAEVVNGEGWRSAGGGRVTPDDLARPMAELRRRLDALHLRRTDGLASPSGAPWLLTAAGRSAALAALRAQALRPRQYAGLG
ncbi:hypothetical protein JOL79_16325 [Microbispora sp. RL4-1S]|uniref:Uncharacterized protein n=1 Tax=Microbispora oryzae TaxID=2806554 RepID=A0A940WL79_9ACTN|nr:hypothetical protein [Microbispora oryzae]MBP2705382.1 hypothetical protein [Microbispora oryzae]